MVNSDLLNDLIKEKGIKKSLIVDKLGTSYHWLNKKISNEKQFKAFEIQKICEILDIKDLKLKEKIFFAPNVDE